METTPPPEMPQRSSFSLWSGLQQRLVSGVMMALVAACVVWLGGGVFITCVIMIGLQMIREWDHICPDTLPYKLLGMLYVSVPCASVIWLRNWQDENGNDVGLMLVLYLVIVVAATDIGAYFTGKRIGGPKLAPAISPNKTWAGLGGGIVSAAVAGAICASFTPYPPSIIACLDLGAVIAVISQGGDLFESWLKRRANVKDSGSLIPGHGGLMDRLDGYVFALPVFALCVWQFASVAQ